MAHGTIFVSALSLLAAIWLSLGDGGVAHGQAKPPFKIRLATSTGMAPDSGATPSPKERAAASSGSPISLMNPPASAWS